MNFQTVHIVSNPIIKIYSTELKMEEAENKKSTDPQLVKDALRESEERFRILMEATKEGVVVHDRFKIIYANHSIFVMLGYKRPEIMGRDFLELAAPQSRDIILQKLLAKTESPYETICLTKDGRQLTVELCSKVIPKRNNLIYLTLFHSLGSRPQATCQEASAGARLDRMFDYAPDAYYLTDSTGKFIDVNKAAEELFGQKKEDIIGKSFLKSNILAPDQIHKAAKHLALNIFGKQTKPEEYVVQEKEGRQIPVEIRTVPVEIKGENLIMGMVRDITAKKLLEAALRRAGGKKETPAAEIPSGPRADR